MKKSRIPEYISKTRIQDIYYMPLKYTDYRIVTKLDENSHEPGYSEFIEGIGKPKNLGQTDYLFGTYEHFISTHKVVADTSLLLYSLSVASQLFDDSGHRLGIGENEKRIALEFCNKYGLYEQKLIKMSDDVDEIPEYRISIWNLIRGLQSLYITCERVDELLTDDKNEKDLKMHCLVHLMQSSFSCFNYYGLYNESKKKIVQVLVACSLLDIANYQLVRMLGEDGTHTRKCANPACSRVMLLDGRSDRKTCSGKCRIALNRHLNKSKKEGEENGKK